MKIDQVIRSSQLIVFTDPVVDEFLDKNAGKAWNCIQTRCEATKQFLLKFGPKYSHI